MLPLGIGTAITKCSTDLTSPECGKAVLETASSFDPTGILGTISAWTLAGCENVVDVCSAWGQQCG